MELNLSLDRKNLARFRTLAKASRLMAAKALTFTAERAVPEWRAGHTVFKRRNSWIDKGVRMRAATPGNLVAQVGTLDKYMGRHVKGIGEPKKGRLFVPNYDDIGEVGTHRRVRAMLRRMDTTKRKPFRVGDMILRRKDKGRLPLVVLGSLRKGAKIEPRLDAEAIVERVVNREFPTLYERLLISWAEKGR